MLPVNEVHKGKASVFTSVPIICYVDSADGSERAEQLLHKQPQNNIPTMCRQRLSGQNPDFGEILMGVALLRVEVSGILAHVPSICTRKVGVQRYQ